MLEKDAKSNRPARRLSAQITTDSDRIRQAQKLRYRVFALDMGAKLKGAAEQLDYDEIDDYCDHLIVIDNQSDRIVGYTRLLNQSQAAELGYFYSQSEFDLNSILNLPGNFLEIGRTCVDADYRGSAVLTTLWTALIQYCIEGHYDYLFGCASIPPGPNGYAVDALYRTIDAGSMADNDIIVTPKTPIPKQLRCDIDESGIPPLLKAYLRFGVKICGQPCWDKDFNVMDLFILLPLKQLGPKYSKHYMKKQVSNVAINDTTL